jgi:hypothetical protein
MASKKKTTPRQTFQGWREIAVSELLAASPFDFDAVALRARLDARLVPEVQPRLDNNGLKAAKVIADWLADALQGIPPAPELLRSVAEQIQLKTRGSTEVRRRAILEIVKRFVVKWRGGETEQAAKALRMNLGTVDFRFLLLPEAHYRRELARCAKPSKREPALVAAALCKLAGVLCAESDTEDKIKKRFLAAARSAIR